jgi:hypothetical protein
VSKPHSHCPRCHGNVGFGGECIDRNPPNCGHDGEDTDPNCPSCQTSLRQSALDAGIPASVVEGKTKLTDHFSPEYIKSQTNSKGDE